MIRLLPVVLAAFALAACDREPDREVLARVNGEPVYAADVNAARERIFGEDGLLEEPGEDSVRGELLESVIASRLLARRAEARMSEAELRRLDAQTRAWREEQLLLRHLRESVTPRPVTRQMVRDYYRDNPEAFGAGARYQYEALHLTTDDETLRDRAIEALADAAGEDDWAALAERLRAAGIPLDHRQGRARREITDETLLARLRSLEPGESDGLRVEGNTLSRVRLLDVEQAPARPLQEVSEEIRMRLAPLQLRQAVREVMDEALEDAEIEYME